MRDAPAAMVEARQRRRFFFAVFFFFAAFFFIFGRDFFAAFFFFGFLRAFGFAAGFRDSSRCAGAGTGAGIGADGNIGSMNPGPGQLLSVFSICSSIGSLLCWLWPNSAYSLPADWDLASDECHRFVGPTSAAAA